MAFFGTRARKEPKALYRMYGIKGKGKAMQATRDIQPGERIIAEEPPITFPSIPPDVMDPEQLLASRKGRSKSKKLANGIEMVAQHVKDMPEDRRKALRDLHGPPEDKDDDEDDESDMLKIARNAFTHKSHVRSKEFETMRVYDHISRFNHSCQPNAVVEWNEELGKGTVHALIEIDDNAEITIDYLSVAESSLSPTVTRRDLLGKTYGFVCSCTACGPEETIRKKIKKSEEQTASIRVADESEASRTAAKAAFDKINFNDVRTTFESKDMRAQLEVARTQQVAILIEYITALRKLRFYDYKLARAYEARGLLYEQAIFLAEYKRKNKKAPRSFPDDKTQDLLKLAEDDWRSCYRVQMRCQGLDHPDTKRKSEKLEELVQGLLPFQFEDDDL